METSDSLYGNPDNLSGNTTTFPSQVRTNSLRCSDKNYKNGYGRAELLLYGGLGLLLYGGLAYYCGQTYYLEGLAYYCMRGLGYYRMEEWFIIWEERVIIV
jgi:hypothetical protein